MLRLSVLQDQWLILSLAIGVVLVIGIAGSYLELWRPRKEEGETASDVPNIPGVTWFISYVPWMVALLTVAAGIWGLLYALDKMAHPPNW